MEEKIIKITEITESKENYDHTITETERMLNFEDP